VLPPSVIPLGDRALTIDVPAADGVSTRDRIASLTARLRAEAMPGITALVPGIRTLTVHYEPLTVSADRLAYHLDTQVRTTIVAPSPEPAPVVIPVCYGLEHGPDLAAVASFHATTAEAIIAAHTDGVYTVAMIGFLPGFPYLDGLDAALHTPRRSAPRTLVPAGSVGIGGSSTGIYPFASPGGWQLIGRTPSALFDARHDPPALLAPGDRVRFESISDARYRALAGTR